MYLITFILQLDTFYNTKPLILTLILNPLKKWVGHLGLGSDTCGGCFKRWAIWIKTTYFESKISKVSSIAKSE